MKIQMFPLYTTVLGASLALTGCPELDKDLVEVEEFAEKLWEEGENDMTALSSEERMYYLGHTPGDDEPSHAEAEEIASENHADFLASSDVLETKIDYRDIGGNDSYVNLVRNQGQCGSCVAFAVTAVMSTTLRVSSRAGPVSERDLPDVSVGQLAFCGGRENICETGWWPEEALESALSTGLTTASSYPYTATPQDCDTSLINSDQVSTITSYTTLTDRDAMIDWLYTTGPLVATFTVYDDFWGYNEGIYHLTDGASSEGGHAVAVIGYGTDETTGTNYWIVQNSWGTGWGEEGYFKIAFGQVGIDDMMWGIEPGEVYYGQTEE